ncbi:MAG TPA: MetQ/NlpA family ABC transporter substrate-binding protein [Cellulomonas sp.]|uniref:MetQ/NlpA family ABC transporter substrate-binding protein n=1 Tax=Cellulomonas sp. TaxID=40001 RepID=UPI002E381A89|nr:MetQ/NlpA family ABC transporter substrate-binding protein [Cellulomonas sp.]HEX5332533.1 MetQ/NlpA family ABC transporter substrate-binding protein [Cellulomonas sp.]
MRKTWGAIALATAATLALAACGSATASDTTSASAAAASSGAVTTLTIGASPVPQAQILQFVQDNLAKGAGLNLKIVTFDDYVLPNTSLAEGELDANYFQHLPYYESQVKAQGFKFDHFAGIHIEPLAVYSSKYKKIGDVPDGAKLGITNDPGNQARALELLVKNNLLTLKDTGDALPTLLDIATNPKNLEFVETAPEQLVRSLQDVDLAIINGNFALDAGLNPTNDSLLIESGVDNPYANFLAVRAEDKTNPAIVTLDGLLHSPEVKAFIEKQWPDGGVLPAF